MENETPKIILAIDDLTKKSIDEAWEKIKTVKDEQNTIWSYNEKNELICGAHTKSGKPCMKSPINGRNRCRLHGGATPRGIASPHAKTLRYSKDTLGKALGERYETAMNDDHLLEMRDEIALLRARLSELIENVESGDTQKTWRELKKHYGAFIRANKNRDERTAADELNQVGKLINVGYNQHQSWREIIETISANRRLVESERKRLVDMQQMMTAEQAMGMLTYIVSVIKKRVYEIIGGDKAQELLAAISADISQYISTTSTVKYKNIAGDD